MNMNTLLDAQTSERNEYWTSK